MIKDSNFKTELLTINKVPTFRMVALSFFSISLIIFTCSYHIEAKTNTESQTYKNLMGVGINSSREYLNCKDWVQKAPVVGSVEEYRQVLTDGWRTLNFIVCAQEHFPNNILDEELVRIKLEAIRGQIRQLKKDFSDRSFTITFKGYDKLPARWADGTKITELYDRIRKSKQMEKQYLKWWKLASEIFKDEKTVVFWPMNEPDYRLEGGLEYHLKLSTKVIDEIRNVNPQRWIILNGYSHSLVGRGRSIFKIMKPIDRENIVYGFHVYGTNKSKYNLPDFYEKNVISDISQWDKKTKDALNEITKFKKNFNVPVMVSEVGIVAKSKYIKRGVESEERARFFKEVISPWSIKCKCGFF